MKLKEILTPSFRDCHRDSTPVSVASGDSDFCHEAVAKGWLTKEQMEHAAMHYRLGRSRSGKTIFWMIDGQGQVLDGRLGTSWVSLMLKAREPQLLRDWHARHCLFGMHLTKDESAACCVLPPIAVVRSERSAVVLSELFPGYVWLASMYDANLTPESLLPLLGHSVTLFPHADPAMGDYVSLLELAQLMHDSYRMDIAVSPLLEDHATPEQKRRGVDLLGYVLDS